jgi:ectoine hydroxylase-related dioxygenase (phytanoyl-CoA dioxygenase family)
VIDSNLKKYQILKNVEDIRAENEKTARVREHRQTIIENIRNYYNDKIRLFKDKLNERKTSKALLNFEQKVVFSEARRERFRESKVRHEKSLENIYQKVQKMKLEMEDETLSIQAKILKLYKNSAKSIKSCNFR